MRFNIITLDFETQDEIKLELPDVLSLINRLLHDGHRPIIVFVDENVHINLPLAVICPDELF
jgi:hypothetical protein